MTFQSFFWDTGALTLHDNCVGLRVGTQETLAEHQTIERVKSTSKIGNNLEANSPHLAAFLESRKYIY